MAKRAAAAAAASTGKRQRGYTVTIKGFIPMEDSIEGQIATLELIREVQNGDIADAAKVMKVSEVKARATSKPAEPASE